MGTTKKIPQRQCVGCRMMKNKKELIRILKTDEGIIIDDTGKKNGRGAYICPACVSVSSENTSISSSISVSSSDSGFALSSICDSLLISMP